MSGFDQITPTNAGRMLGGRYRLIAPIARGGMAEVWEAHDEVLSRPVAVKMLQAHLAADGVFLERFRREAVTAARLAHPSIVATFDTGLDAGTAYIVMELVKGRNLRQLLSDAGRLEPWQAVAIARQIADGLAYAHQAGLVHRDIKPANVLLVEDEWGSVRVKVTDFGIAKAGEGTGSDLTRTGIVLGTPKYLSPEQIRGADPDARADLYALGCVLYEMLTGAPPYVGDNEMATALAHINDRVPRPGAQVRGIPAGLDKVVTDLLAKNPDRRVPSATALRQRLDALGPLAAPTGSFPVVGNGRWAGRRTRPGGPAGPTPGPAPGGPSRGGPGPVSLGPPPGGPGPVPGGAAPPESFSPVSPAGSPSMPPGAGHPTRALEEGSTIFMDPGLTRADAATSVLGSPGPPANGGPARSGPVSGTIPAPPTSAPYPSPPRGPGVPSGRQGPTTDEFGVVPHAARRFRRSERAAGLVVLGLVLIGLIVAAVVLSDPNHHHSSPPAQASSTGAKVAISSVSVFMVDNRPPDNPGQTPLTFDGNPSTYWETDHYLTPTFSNLYPGIGLAIVLNSSTTLHTLTVTSPTSGWSAQAYVSTTPVASGQAVSAWGQASDTHTSIGAGTTTFHLGGHHDSYVLLWITNLGPSDQVMVSELGVS